MLFEHVAPSLDDVQQCLFERPSVHSEPSVKDLRSIYFVNFSIKFLVSVNLENIKKQQQWVLIQ